MKKKGFTSKVRTQLVYTEAKPGSGENINDSKNANYDFTAKFKRGKTNGSGKSGISQSEKSIGKEITTLKESLVVEKDPQNVRIAFEKPPSQAYKILVKSSIIDTSHICPFAVSLLLFLATLILAIFVQIQSSSLTQFTIDYNNMLSD